VGVGCTERCTTWPGVGCSAVGALLLRPVVICRDKGGESVASGSKPLPCSMHEKEFYTGMCKMPTLIGHLLYKDGTRFTRQCFGHAGLTKHMESGGSLQWKRPAPEVSGRLAMV
jgi:hypothetical protein